MSAAVATMKPDGAGLDALLAAVKAGANQDLAHAETLPPRSYISPELFALEEQRIFRADWISVGHVAQIAHVGDYFTRDVLGELLVIVRAERGVRVMSRVCLHRWAPVATGSGNTKMFSCPFHRWGYDLDGRLRSAPLMDGAAGFDPANCRLTEFRSEIVFGTIYVNFDGQADSIAERLEDAIPIFGRYKMEELVIAYGFERVCNFNWKIAVETFMECYHHIGAHAKTAEPTSPGRLSFGIDGHKGWTACYSPLRPDLPTSEKTGSGLPVFEGLSDEVIRNGGLYVIYPVNLITTNADRIHWTTVLPVAVDKCIWIRLVLVRPEAQALPDYQEIVARVQAKGMAIFEEDIAVNDMQQLGAATSSAGVGRLSHLERPVWQFANYVRGMLQD
jgi:phenylpropionate dioxygenase-like ring-hydroxylating dioxygenase large terminal subunit